MRSLSILILSLFIFAFSTVSYAGETAVVDFQRAINEVKQGVKAKEKLDSMYAQRQQQMAGLEQQLQTKLTEYEQQRALLSDTARAEKEQELMQMQGQAQQMAYQAEMEMQEAYAKEMEALIVKMRDIAIEIAKARTYDIVLEATEGGVVYHSDKIPDITNEVIKKFDAKYPG